VQFLGPCEICSQTVRTYRSLANHLRHQKDPAHQDLKKRWHTWRNEYRATLRCRKCGEIFSITDKSDRDRKRCDRCGDLRASVSKRAYGALSFNKPSDPRQMMTAKGSKAQWDGLVERVLTWKPGDAVYSAVVGAIQQGRPLNDIKTTVGVSYVVVKEIGEHAFPDFQERMAQRKIETMRQNVEAARTDSALERLFASQLEAAGFPIVGRNVWTTLRVGAEKVKREVDIKVAVGDGRKVVVLCDGEAFHGPKAIHGDPQVRIASDRETALAYFGLGYSVVRYSETEIHDGTAVEHFQGLMGRLEVHKKIYRNWHPVEETFV